MAIRISAIADFFCSVCDRVFFLDCSPTFSIRGVNLEAQAYRCSTATPLRCQQSFPREVSTTSLDLPWYNKVRLLWKQQIQKNHIHLNRKALSRIRLVLKNRLFNNKYCRYFAASGHLVFSECWSDRYCTCGFFL